MTPLKIASIIFLVALSAAATIGRVTSKKPEKEDAKTAPAVTAKPEVSNGEKKRLRDMPPEVRREVLKQNIEDLVRMGVSKNDLEQLRSMAEKEFGVDLKDVSLTPKSP